MDSQQDLMFVLPKFNSEDIKELLPLKCLRFICHCCDEKFEHYFLCYCPLCKIGVRAMRFCPDCSRDQKLDAAKRLLMRCSHSDEDHVLMYANRLFAKKIIEKMAPKKDKDHKPSTFVTPRGSAPSKEVSPEPETFSTKQLNDEFVSGLTIAKPPFIIFAKGMNGEDVLVDPMGRPVRSGIAVTDPKSEIDEDELKKRTALTYFNHVVSTISDITIKSAALKILTDIAWNARSKIPITNNPNEKFEKTEVFDLAVTMLKCAAIHFNDESLKDFAIKLIDGWLLLPDHPEPMQFRAYVPGTPKYMPFDDNNLNKHFVTFFNKFGYFPATPD